MIKTVRYQKGKTNLLYSISKRFDEIKDTKLKKRHLLKLFTFSSS